MQSNIEKNKIKPPIQSYLLVFPKDYLDSAY